MTKKPFWKMFVEMDKCCREAVIRDLSRSQIWNLYRELFPSSGLNKLEDAVQALLLLGR